MTALETADRMFDDGRLVDEGGELVQPEFLIIRLFSRQPAEFLDAYHLRRDGRPPASATVPRTVSQWARDFYSKGMDAVGNELALSSLDRGNAPLALRIWKAIYEHHPDPSIPKDLLAARIIWAAALCSSPEEIPNLQQVAGDVHVGDGPLRISDWKKLAPMLSPQGPRSDWKLVSGDPVTVGPVTAEAAHRGNEWVVSVRMKDRRADLFAVDPFFAEFLKVVVWATDDTLGWASTAGWSGEWDLAEWRPIWSGASTKRPPPRVIATGVAEALSVERDECIRRLEGWIHGKRSLLRSWHTCEFEQERSDLWATSRGMFWICPCGQVTPMDSRGIRSASVPGIGALGLSNPERRAMERVRGGN